MTRLFAICCNNAIPVINILQRGRNCKLLIWHTWFKSNVTCLRRPPSVKNALHAYHHQELSSIRFVHQTSSNEEHVPLMTIISRHTASCLLLGKLCAVIKSTVAAAKRLRPLRRGMTTTVSFRIVLAIQQLVQSVFSHSSNGLWKFNSAIAKIC